MTFKERIQFFIRGIIGIPEIEKKIGEIGKAPKDRNIIPFNIHAGYNLPEPAPLDMQGQLDSNRSWVYGCVQRRASEIANIQLKLFQRKSADDIIEIPVHDSLDLLDSVNNYMTRYDLFEWLSMSWDLTGECYWWKIKSDKGKIVSIYPYFNPAHMTVVPSKDTFINGYIYSVPGTGELVPFKPEEIIFFKQANPANPYRGLSPVKAAEYAIGTDRQAAKWNYNFFSNSARPGGILLYPGTMNETQFQRLKTQWEEIHKGLENAHKVAIIESGDPEGKTKADFKETGFAQKEMDFVEQRKFSRDEIFAAFGVPKGVMTAEDVNRATAVSHKAFFIENTITPLYRKIVSYLNEFLLPDYNDDSLFFDFKDPTIRDIETTLRYWESGLKNGWLSPNEVREAEGFPAFSGGENVFAPFNAVSIGQVSDKKKSKPVYISRQRRTKREKIANIIQKAVKQEKIKEKLYSLTKGFKKNLDIKKLGKFSSAFKEKYGIVYLKMADQYEKQFAGVIREFFEEQKKRILGTVEQKWSTKTSFNTPKQAAKGISIRFNLKDEMNMAVTAFEPVIRNLIAEYGEDIMEMFGLTEFDITEERILEFLRGEGLKFAKEMNRTTKDKILAEIARGAEAGETITEIRNRIKEVFNAAGVKRATAIARTEVIRASNFAAIEGYRQSGVVKAKEWLVTPDDRLCPYCAAMEGKVIELEENFFDKDDEFQGNAETPMKMDYGDIMAPPLHPNCRCTLIPVLGKSQRLAFEKRFFNKQQLKKKIRIQEGNRIFKKTLKLVRKIKEKEKENEK